MAGFTHFGIGLAAKRILPQVPVGYLVVAAYTIDIVWGVFWWAGLEHWPQPGVTSIAPWSHGLFMSVVWSLAALLITRLVSRNTRMSILIGLLVFSHWLVDFIAKPMTHAFPTDSGLPLLFAGSRTVGLGLWGTAAGEYVGEYGMVALGAVVYAITLAQIRRNKRWPAEQPKHSTSGPGTLKS